MYLNNNKLKIDQVCKALDISTRISQAIRKDLYCSDLVLKNYARKILILAGLGSECRTGGRDEEKQIVESQSFPNKLTKSPLRLFGGAPEEAQFKRSFANTTEDDSIYNYDNYRLT